MRLIAGVDIGNSTTEVVIGEQNQENKIKILSFSTTATTGLKGTTCNVEGIKKALLEALTLAHSNIEDIELICINEATPVIGDTAMETITETIITESSMIGHNPGTPAGYGYAVGYTATIESIYAIDAIHSGIDTPTILLVDDSHSYEEVATLVNHWNIREAGYPIKGIILQSDEAVLVYNRIEYKIPIIDEVKRMDVIKEGKLAAIEVAMQGQSVAMLSNPYGIATLLHLTGEETKSIIPIAKSLLGKRSGVVIKAENGNVTTKKVAAGELIIHGDDIYTVSVDDGAEAIMSVIEDAGNIIHISGSRDTNVGNMIHRMKMDMSKVSFVKEEDISIEDILAVDTLAPVKIQGALAGETALEKAVGIAAMVKTSKLPMNRIAKELQQELKVTVKVAGVEGIMASIGAVTTPGVSLPLALLDIGGGSTDGAMILEDGKIEVVHMAGAGELVTLLIQTELGLTERKLAEEIKKYPLAKVESLYYIRLESGEIQFIEEGISPEFYGGVVLLHPSGMIRIDSELTLERIMQVRKEAKQNVFVTNARRVLKKIAPKHNIRNIANIILVGGCALDFEVPSMLMEEFMQYNIVCGRGNILGEKGPRYAVATGLVLSNIGRRYE